MKTPKVYQLGNFSFHRPITKKQAKQANLPIKMIDELKTTGQPIKELVSVQFVKKLVALVETGNYTFLAN